MIVHCVDQATIVPMILLIYMEYHAEKPTSADREHPLRLTVPQDTTVMEPLERHLYAGLGITVQMPQTHQYHVSFLNIALKEVI